MVKKILSIIMVVALLCGITCSVSAAGDGSGVTRYAVLPFDTVTVYDGDSISEYACVVSREGRSVYVEAPGIALSQTSTIVTNDGSMDIRANISCEDGPSAIVLTGRNVVMRVGDLKRLTVSAGNNTSGGCVARISGTFLRLAPLFSVYGVVPTSFERSSTDSIVDVRAMLLSELPNESVVLFETITLRLEGVSSSADGYYTIRMSSASSPMPSVTEWVNGFTLLIQRISAGAVNLADWLVDAIGSFLEFQLLPGMSLNSIIQFVVVVGIVFWFITLLI